MNYTSHNTHHRVVDTTAAAKSRNSRLSCKAAGCLEHREGLYLHCKAHQRVFAAYGHPKQRPIKPIAYTHYRKAITEIFQVNTTHPGLVSALDWITRWMADAAESDSAYKGAEQIARLVRHGVSPVEVLTEVCAYHCMTHGHPQAHKDSRSEAFGISRAVFQLAPLPRRITFEAAHKGTYGYPLRPKFSALNAIGEQLRSVLAYLLANIAIAVSTRDQLAAETLHQLRAPFTSPTAAFLTEAAQRSASTARKGVPFSPSTTQQPE